MAGMLHTVQTAPDIVTICKSALLDSPLFCLVFSSTYKCTWDVEGAQCLPFYDKCEFNIENDTCTSSQGCYWTESDNNDTNCKYAMADCKANSIYSSCESVKGCIWDIDHLYCSVVDDFRRECSKTFDDISYTGTMNVTCDLTPCLYWTELPFPVDNDLPYETTIGASNFCRNLGGVKDTAECFISSHKYKPCCVPVCEESKNIREERSECVFTVRGRYEYAGNDNTSCDGSVCEKWIDIANSRSKILQYRDVDFPLDGTINAASNRCRNPKLKDEGDICYINSKKGNQYSPSSSKSCCLPPCSDNDQVTCMWTNTGNEYSEYLNWFYTQVYIPWI